MKKTILTLAASLAINLAVVAAYERSVDQVAPAGEVTVTQLVDSAEASLLAQTDGQLVATGNGSL